MSLPGESFVKMNYMRELLKWRYNTKHVVVGKYFKHTHIKLMNYKGGLRLCACDYLHQKRQEIQETNLFSVAKLKRIRNILVSNLRC